MKKLKKELRFSFTKGTTTIKIAFTSEGESIINIRTGYLQSAERKDIRNYMMVIT